MKNLEIARIFYEIADILEMQSVEWKPIAYRRAARGIETLSKPIEEIYEQGGLNALEEIPGVGQRLALKIEEFIKTGRVKEYEKLKRSVPSGVEEMMHVPRMGPKKALLLYKKLGIKSVKDLEAAAKAGKIKKLFRFGAKSEEDILKGIDIFKTGEERMLLGRALPIAREIVSRFKTMAEIKKVVVAGSIRRMKDTVKDIDVLVVSPKSEKVMDFFTKMPNVAAVFAKGPTKSSVRLKEGLNSDVRVFDEKSFGAAMQYFTGSKDHNIRCRQIAIKKGYKLNEYGLFNSKTERYVCGRTEEEVYKKLGLRYIEPELRENRGEIEASMKNQLPNLIGYNDIKGDLQMHTKNSDGGNTIEQMASAAMQAGHEYIAITDHSKGERIAHGMEEKRFLKYLTEIDRINRKIKGIHILKGIEVDILPDGELDFSDKYLSKCDIVVAAVHSRFKSSKAEMTKRILKAMENRHVNILSHPTGRLINARAPYEVDLGKIYDAAVANNVWLEVNSFPTRLDLSDTNIKEAIAHKAKLVIDTDSHSADHLRYMEIGIATARRGWAEKKDIINSLPWKRFEKLI